MCARNVAIGRRPGLSTTVACLAAGVTAISMASPADAWATGFAGEGWLVLHRTGGRWYLVPSTVAGNLTTSAASSRSSNWAFVRNAARGWAVGTSQGASTLEPLIVHWSGKAGTAVASPAATAPGGAELSAVAATSRITCGPPGRCATVTSAGSPPR